VLTLPMVAAVRQLRPEVELLVFAHPRTKPLVEEQPGITAFVLISGGMREVWRALQEWQPEILFFPRPLFEEAWAAYRAGICYRVGSGYRWYSLLFTHRIYEHRRTAQRHEAEYNVRMVAQAAGVAELPVRLLPPRISAQAHRRVQEVMSRLGLSPAAFVVLHPGGRGSAPRWEPESFALLAQRLEGEGMPCVITGTAAERELAERIRHRYPAACLLFGELSMAEFIALLAQARVVVANSTGALHIAAALGVPVVGLYSLLPSHHPRRWGPYTERATVLTPPQGAPPDAVAAIPVELVEQAVRSWWDSGEAGR